MQNVDDDKSEHCIPFILERLNEKNKNGSSEGLLFVGLNGAQGSGKTTLVSNLAEKLSQPPLSLPTTVLSIDDFYLPHHLQSRLAAAHPDNPLVQHRGQPSTHDLPLALSLFSDLRDGKETKIPSYDKGAYNGQGDRVPEDKWEVTNRKGQPITKVVILEGWCVGFRAASSAELERKWADAVKQRQQGVYHGRLGYNKRVDAEFVNEALKGYDELTNQLDALIHLDAADPLFVYQWRGQQEKALREAKGSGMSDEQVKKFVDGYYPAYELFTDRLRAGAFEGTRGKQLRLVIGEDREIKDVELEKGPMPLLANTRNGPDEDNTLKKMVRIIEAPSIIAGCLRNSRSRW